MNPNPPSAPDAKTPTAIEVLRFCADAAPDFWFPSVFSRQTGIDRESLNEPVWMLVKAGLVFAGTRNDFSHYGVRTS